MDKGYGKTLENRLQKSRRITLGDLICLPKPEKRLQFSESAAGKPLNNNSDKQKIVVQGCEAPVRIKTLQAAWEETEEKSPQVTFLALFSKKPGKTLGKLTLLTSLLLNKVIFLLPTQRKIHQESHSLSWTKSNKNIFFSRKCGFSYMCYRPKDLQGFD